MEPLKKTPLKTNPLKNNSSKKITSSFVPSTPVNKLRKMILPIEEEEEEEEVKDNQPLVKKTKEVMKQAQDLFKESI